jgi:hypothetical protein
MDECFSRQQRSLDVFTQDPLWARWSEEELIVHAERDLLAINPIIYAEVSVHFSTLEELDEVLSPMDFQRLPLPYEAGFLAAKCFLAYRRQGGQKHAQCPISTSVRTRRPRKWLC